MPRFSKMTWDLHSATVDLHGVLNVRNVDFTILWCKMMMILLVPT